MSDQSCRQYRMPQRGERGFTLVEILAVVAILALLFSLAMPMVNKAQSAGRITACQQNLRNIALTLKTYVDIRKDGRWPRERGIQLLLRLHKDGELEGDSLKIFNCPGTDDVTWPLGRENEWGASFEDWDNLPTSAISYAGRDMKNHPLNKNKLDQMVLASDDNELLPNHDKITNIVYADGHTGKVDISDWADELAEGVEAVPVGPDSPHPQLQKLMIDY